MSHNLNRGKLELMKKQRFNDGYNIRHVNDPDPSFDHYTGTLNKIDRDTWNDKLSDRNFLIDYPPWYNIVYPQNTSPCVLPDCYKILKNPNLDKRSAKYYNQYTGEFNPCNHQGMPVYCNQGTSLKFQAKKTGNCQPKELKKILSCHPNLKLCKKDCDLCTSQILPELSSPNQNMEYPSSTKCNKSHEPWIYGINRNVDVESRLYRLGDYNERDTVPYNLRDHPELTDPETQRKLFNTFFQDQRHIYPNVTPKIFHNTTKIKNNYPMLHRVKYPGERPDRVNYGEYNRFLKEAQECLAKE